jgi:hypothetical protein
VRTRAAQYVQAFGRGLVRFQRQRCGTVAAANAQTQFCQGLAMAGFQHIARLHQHAEAFAQRAAQAGAAATAQGQQAAFVEQQQVAVGQLPCIDAGTDIAQHHATAGGQLARGGQCRIAGPALEELVLRIGRAGQLVQAQGMAFHHGTGSGALSISGCRHH